MVPCGSKVSALFEWNQMQQTQPDKASLSVMLTKPPMHDHYFTAEPLIRCRMTLQQRTRYGSFLSKSEKENLTLVLCSLHTHHASIYTNEMS